MTDKITWSTEKRKISELIPWPRNPRVIKADHVKRLQDSVEEFGQFETIAIGPENQVYNGHQRLKSWGAKYGGGYEVEVRVSSRALTAKEREKLTILAHKGATGEFDFDILANEFELSDLLEWGFNSIAAVNPENEWQGMPEFNSQDLLPFKSVLVHFASENDLQLFSQLVNQGMGMKTKSIWFPKAEIMRQGQVLENDQS